MRRPASGLIAALNIVAQFTHARAVLALPQPRDDYLIPNRTEREGADVDGAVASG
jgi:hypothetical protein